jgi:hypothetical protein
LAKDFRVTELTWLPGLRPASGDHQERENQANLVVALQAMGLTKWTSAAGPSGGVFEM